MKIIVKSSGEFKNVYRMYMKDSKVNYIREMESIKYDGAIDQDTLDRYNFTAK